MTPTNSVGVVGLGAMGRPIAGHLAAAGFDTYCFDVNSDAVEAASEVRIRDAGSLVALGGCTSVILVMVPSDADVMSVCSPDDGLLAQAGPGTVLLICSSVKPSTCDTVASLAAARGVDVLDAAMTGGVRGAEAGEINLLVGGAPNVLERIRPVLAPWTKSIHHLGKLGSGQVGKTVNNLCAWGQLSAIVEALRLGRALGVEPALLREALMDGPAASFTLRDMQKMRLTWYAKDLAVAFAMAEAVDDDLPVARTAREAMNHISVADIAALYQQRS